MRTRRIPAWAVIRRRVLDRDLWRCRECGRAGRLEVDHVKPLYSGGHETDMRNLQTLCRDCHFIKTAGENSTTPGRAEWTRRVRNAGR